MSRPNILWTVLALLLSGVLVVAFLSSQKKPTEQPTQSNLSAREVALACTSDMATQYHVHPTLKILVNGKEETVPADIGIHSSCMNALHTHDMTGLIHIESPERRDFTLSDFFAVWNQPFSKNQILTYKADTSHAIKVTVNGTEVHTYEDTVLRDGDQIVISYN